MTGGDPAPRRRRRIPLAVRILGGLLALVLLAVGVYAGTLLAGLGRIEKLDETQAPVDYEGRPAATDAVNVLLLGSDSRDPGASLADSVGSRSDTISKPPAGQRAPHRAG